MKPEIWIKFKDKDPDDGAIIEVEFGNGKILTGHVMGDFISYNPKELDFDTIMSKPIKWKLTP